MKYIPDFITSLYILLLLSLIVFLLDLYWTGKR